jgi:hypothetical protein
MRLSSYILILFAITLLFYLGGYQPTAWETLQSSAVGTGGLNINSIINMIYSIFTNPAFLLILIGSMVTGFLLSGSNFSVIYIIPIFILLVVVNLFVFPTSFLFDEALPVLMKVVIGMLFNIFLILSVVEFIRGGEI